MQVKETQGQEAEQKKSSPTPVFVPIVIAMDARDHKLLVEEWYSRQMVSVIHTCLCCQYLVVVLILWIGRVRLDEPCDTTFSKAH